MHRPQQYGDNLMNVRESISIANQQKRYAEGFEEGRIFNGYRYIFPIIDKGRHLGSIEISVSINAIIKHLSHVFKRRGFYFMIQSDVVSATVFDKEKGNYAPSTLHDDYVIDLGVHAHFDHNFEPLLRTLHDDAAISRQLKERFPLVRSLTFRDKAVVATFMPIANLRGEPIAYIISLEYDDSFQSRLNALLGATALSLLVGALLFGAIAYLIWRSGKTLKEKERLDLLVAQKTQALKEEQERGLQHYRNVILALINLTEERDTYTAGHTRRVADYAKMLALSMHLPKEMIERLYEAAVLHDIGKIVTPDSVLLKPGRLNPKEFDIIKEHVLVGESILRNIDFSEEIITIMKYHHERLDGSGYPYGLKGDDIPLCAQILAVADTFDAMTTNRIYKPRKSIADSLAELHYLAGIHYNPTIVAHAQGVFRTINIDLSVTQLPTSVIEQERLSHYFKDPLTNLYNLRYLQLLLQQHEDHQQFVCANVIAIRNFGALNTTQGWETGNKVLVLLGEYLEERFNTSQIFRIYGDDFVILSNEHIKLDTERMRESFEKTSNVMLQFHLLHFDLHDKASRLHFLEDLEKAVG
ncbi:MAG: HD domain-containing protein [Campylobacterales bacterium]|nr:HD domain-containing protein [Campylobacterales bacterium]